MAFKFEDTSGGDLENDAPPIIAEINVTPLVDVFLLLLVIFMVTSSAISTSNIPVQLPQSAQASAAAKESPGVIITVNSQGRIYVNGTIVDDSELATKMSSVLEKSNNKTIILEGDRQAMLGTIVRIMDEGKKAGASKFAFSTKNSEN